MTDKSILTEGSELVSLQRTLTERYPIGLATIGNSLRCDDDIASRVCDALPSSALKYVCRYDLGTYTSFLGECLRKHKAAIVIDATANGTTSGATMIVNIETLLKGDNNIKIRASHGFSFLDELRICARSTTLPNPFYFFGIEVKSCEWSENISPELEMQIPQLAQSLESLIEKMLETLSKKCSERANQKCMKRA